jgi:methyl-accepting chemotaxis protein
MLSFNKLSVSKRFLLSAAVIIPLLLALGGAGIWGVSQVNSIVHNTNQVDLPAIYYLGLARNKVAEVRLDSRQLVLETLTTRIEQTIASTKQDLSEARESWENYTKLPASQEAKEKWNLLEADWDAWDKQSNELARLVSLNTTDSHNQAQLILNRALFLSNKVSGTLDDLYNLTHDQSLQEAQDAQTNYVTVVGMIAVLTLIIAGLILVVGWLVAKSIIKLTSNMDNLNTQLKEAYSTTESKRQLGETTSRRLNSMAVELKATSGQQTRGSQQQASSIAQATSSLTELAQAADSIAQTSNQIYHTAEEVLASTRQVKVASDRAGQTGQTGLEAMQETILTNQQLNQFYQELVADLTAMQQDSSEIKAVIKLIREISDETHLLALNAAIEAAGAGVYGERFGVIAGEVKRLADRSGQSSREVDNILSKIQKRIPQVLETAQLGHTQTETAVKVAQETGLVITELAQTINDTSLEIFKVEEAMTNMNKLSQEISLATSQQSSAARQVVQTLQSLAVIAQQSASSSAQVTTTVSELEELSYDLNLALVV